jgi:hypothetical protein
MFREESGAAALSGRDLPTDQTLAAHAHVCARAAEYKESGAFPHDTRMDQYRVAAFLDLINGIPAEARIASGKVITVTPASTTPDADTAGERGAPDPDAPEWDTGNPDDPGDADFGDDPDDDDPGNDGPKGEGPGGGGPGGGGSPGSPGGCGSPPSPPRLADLVLPLATLLGLAERPGEGHGLGPLDPGLCRALAASAAASPYSQLCVTVTDQDGIAIGHGCARLIRRRTRQNRPGSAAGQDSQGLPGGSTALALPARANLTITANRLADLARTTGPPGRAPWSFTRDDPGPPDAHGTWTLTLPDGRNLTAKLEPVPTFECDHKHESHAYQPNDTLRHLVQIRDGECTFPPCSRHARESDFEHAVPYDKGGKTCACNAGARSRQCHQVKQSPGWNVTQLRPGWHQWETPSGRVYTQGPKRYPAD